MQVLIYILFKIVYPFRLIRAYMKLYFIKMALIRLKCYLLYTQEIILKIGIHKIVF